MAEVESNNTHNNFNNRKRILTDSSLSPQQYPKVFKQQGLEQAMDRDLGSKVRLHISNIPYEMKWQELKDLVREKIGAEVFVEIYNGPDGRPSGIGAIEVKSIELAKKAIDTLHRLDVRGRQLVVREENTEDVMKRMHSTNGAGMGVVGMQGPRPSGMMSSGAMPSSMGMMNSSMMSGDFNFHMLGELGIDPALITNQVFVANLDYKVTVENLEEVFRIAGNVLAVELKMDKDNKFRGMATVRFEHPIESVQAISLFHGQRYFGRPMSVRMDRWNDPKPQVIPKMLPTGLESIGAGLGLNGSPLFSLGQIANTLALGNLSSFLRNKTSSGGMGSLPGLMGGHMPRQMGMGSSGQMDQGSSGVPNNLETIIAATIRAVTGQLGGLPVDGSQNSGMMRQQNVPMDVGGYGSSPGAGAYGGGGMNPWTGGGPTAAGGDVSSSGMWSGDPSRRTGSVFSSPVDALTATRLMTAEGDPNTLFVGNLTLKFTWQSLKDKFKEIGNVLFADVKPEADRSGSYGLVRFKNPDDASKAISMLQGSTLDGRKIEVCYLKQRQQQQYSSGSGQANTPAF